MNPDTVSMGCSSSRSRNHTISSSSSRSHTTLLIPVESSEVSSSTTSVRHAGGFSPTILTSNTHLLEVREKLESSTRLFSLDPEMNPPAVGSSSSSPVRSRSVSKSNVVVAAAPLSDHPVASNEVSTTTPTVLVGGFSNIILTSSIHDVLRHADTFAPRQSKREEESGARTVSPSSPSPSSSSREFHIYNPDTVYAPMEKIDDEQEQHSTSTPNKFVELSMRKAQFEESLESCFPRKTAVANVGAIKPIAQVADKFIVGTLSNFKGRKGKGRRGAGRRAYNHDDDDDDEGDNDDDDNDNDDNEDIEDESCVWIVVIDQHAASERVNLEQVQRAPVVVKRVHPVHVHLDPADIRALGSLDVPYFRFNPVYRGHASNPTPTNPTPTPNPTPTTNSTHTPNPPPNTIAVTALPYILGEMVPPLKCIEALLEKRDPIAAKQASKACHRSIRFGDALTHVQVEKLIADLGACKDSFHCAHGRPTVYPLFSVSKFRGLYPACKSGKKKLGPLYV